MSQNRLEQRRYLLRYYWPLAITLPVIAGGIAGMLGYSFFSTALALLLLALCLYPAVEHQCNNKQEFPTIAIIAAAFAFQYALPVFLGDRIIIAVPTPIEVPQEALVAGLCLALAAMIVFIAVCYSKITQQAMRHLPVMQLHLNRTRALLFCALLGGVSLVSTSLLAAIGAQEGGSYGALIQVLTNQILVVIGILSWMTYSGGGRWVRVALYAVIFLASARGMSSGFLEAAVTPVVIALGTRWFYTRRINKKLAALLVGVVFFLSPVKSEFRDTVWFGSGQSKSAVEKAIYWVDTAASYWLNVVTGDVDATSAASDLAKRTNLIDLLAHVYDSTPGRTPFVSGETYEYFVYSLIPRILWPEKPQATANTMLAVKYWLTTAEGAERSSFGLGLLGEGYANFGFPGVIGIACVLALALLLIQQLFGTSRSGPGGAAILFAFVVSFINGIGSSAQIVLGNIIQSLLMSYILLHWVTEKRSAHLTAGVQLRARR
jgi:hypothetical protein